MKIIRLNSLSSSKKPRKTSDIRFVVIHYTGMQSKRASLVRLLNKKYKVSCHYLIDRSGNIIKMLDDNKVAWHAGKSKWKKFNNLNETSIGIELVNKGHRISYEKFPNKQIKNLIKLSKFLKKKYKIKQPNFLGHSDIAPLRKRDPGEYFPWLRLSKQKLGIWYPKLNKKIKVVNKKKMRNLFFKNLHKIGYRYFNKTKSSKKDRLIVQVFQSKFLPKKADGKIDIKTYIISHFLANDVNY
tara:strand:- start:101 stop:823 length:723 start_codon:yes stop_codon:yes gene_type:complete